MTHNDFYVEDMDDMYEDMLNEEAHFHYTVNEFISLDMDGLLEPAIIYIQEYFPLTFDKIVRYIKENE